MDCLKIVNDLLCSDYSTFWLTLVSSQNRTFRNVPRKQNSEIVKGLARLSSAVSLSSLMLHSLMLCSHRLLPSSAAPSTHRCNWQKQKTQYQVGEWCSWLATNLWRCPVSKECSCEEIMWQLVTDITALLWANLSTSASPTQRRWGFIPKKCQKQNIKLTNTSAKFACACVASPLDSQKSRGYAQKNTLIVITLDKISIIAIYVMMLLPSFVFTCSHSGNTAVFNHVYSVYDGDGGLLGPGTILHVITTVAA